MFRKFFLLLFTLFLAALTTFGEGPLYSALARSNVDLSVSLSQKQLRVNQSAALTITVTGAKSAEIELPEMDDIVFQQRGQSRKIQIINGDFSSSVATSYHVRPLKKGNYTIPPITVRVGDEVMKTKPLSFTVVADAVEQGSSVGQSGETTGNNGLAFLKIENLPEDGYRGQLIPVTIKAYFREGIRAEIDHLPAITGASYVLTPLDRQPLQGQETVNGRNYSVLIWKSSISAIKAGRHPLQIGLEATLLIPVKNRPGRGLDPFLDDDAFRGFFDRIKRKDVNLQSTAHMMAIAPLPEEGKPADFNGAVGDFNFKVEASPRQVEIGEPVTLTMTISGEGNFDTVSAPDFPVATDWKTYSPVSRFEDKGEGYRGIKIFEQAVVPTTGEVQAIPELSFSYFDPAEGSYITINSDLLPLHVSGGKALATQLPSKQSDTTLDSPSEKDQLLPTIDQHLTSSSFTPAINPVFQLPWFIILTALTTVVLITVVFLHLRKRYLSQNHQLLQEKVLKKTLAEKDNVLQMAIKQGEDGLFLKTCREMIQIHLAHLADASNREPASLILSDLKNMLPAESPLIEIFAVAQEHAYGGGRLTVAQMEQYRQQLRSSLEENR